MLSCGPLTFRVSLLLAHFRILRNTSCIIYINICIWKWGNEGIHKTFPFPYLSDIKWKTPEKPCMDSFTHMKMTLMMENWQSLLLSKWPLDWWLRLSYKYPCIRRHWSWVNECLINQSKQSHCAICRNPKKMEQTSCWLKENHGNYPAGHSKDKSVFHNVGSLLGLKFSDHLNHLNHLHCGRNFLFPFKGRTPAGKSLIGSLRKA